MRVELRPVPSGQPGEGRLIIRGWQGSNEALSLIIQESQADQFLQGNGSWGAAEHSFLLPVVSQSDDGFLYADRGPEIVDPLVAHSGSAQFQFLLSDGDGNKDRSVLKLARNLMPSSAAGQAPASMAPTQLASRAVQEPTPPVEPDTSKSDAQEPSASEAPIPPARPAPAAEPSAPIAPQKGTRSGLITVLVIVLLLILTAAGTWFWLNRDRFSTDGSETNERQESTVQAADTPASQDAIGEDASDALEQSPGEASPSAGEPQDAPPQDEQTPAQDAAKEDVPASAQSQDDTEAPAEPAAPTCSATQLDSAQELDFVKQCVSQDLSSEQLLEVITAARDAGRCGIAQRLYANRAMAGDPAIAMAYAREFDPEFHRNNGCFADADADTAGYWYQVVLDNAPDNAEASERLEALTP